MSWLLVGFIPGLLMLATFALERLEAGLSRDTVSTSDVDDFLKRAGAHDGNRRVAQVSAATDTGHGRLYDRFEGMAALPTRIVGQDPGTRSADTPLPTPICIPHRPNPQFQATRHPDRV